MINSENDTCATCTLFGKNAIGFNINVGNIAIRFANIDLTAVFGQKYLAHADTGSRNINGLGSCSVEVQSHAGNLHGNGPNVFTANFEANVSHTFSFFPIITSVACEIQSTSRICKVNTTPSTTCTNAATLMNNACIVITPNFKFNDIRETACERRKSYFFTLLCIPSCKLFSTCIPRNNKCTCRHGTRSTVSTGKDVFSLGCAAEFSRVHERIRFGALINTVTYQIIDGFNIGAVIPS